MSETVQLTTPPAVLLNAQAGKAAITGRVYHLYQQVDTAVDIRQSVDMTAEHQAFMILVVKENLVKVVIKSAKVMDFQIVMICKQVAEPPAIPRSFEIVTTEAVLTSTTLLSILNVYNYSSYLEKNKGSYPYEPLLYYHKLI